jgi:hypothetical protein
MTGRGTVKRAKREADGVQRDVWVCELAPDLLMRLKRVLGKADRGGVGPLLVTDTLDTCRDLAWFLDRHGAEVEVTPRDLLLARAGEHQAREEQVRAILKGTSAGYRAPSFELVYPPRDYQRVAADLWLTAGGLLLADELGLGKSVSAIAGLTDQRTLPALIVTETHLVFQWAREVARFAPNLRVHVAKDGKPVDLRTKHRGHYPDVILLNYAKLSKWADMLAPDIRSVTFDECQALRTGGILPIEEQPQKYRAALKLCEAVSFRLGLSATPVYNYGGEMFSIGAALWPGRLGTLEEFKREWCTQGLDTEGRPKLIVKNPRALGAHLRGEGLMLRRTRRDVGRELPPLTRVRQMVDANMAELAKVSASVAELARIITGEKTFVPTAERGMEAMKAGGELDWRLRQATGLAKGPFVADFVRLLLESEEKVLLAGWHHEVYAVWRERLAEFKPAFFTGQASPTQKDAALRAFVQGDSRVLMLSLRAGSGLNGIEKVCRTVVHGEMDWSPAVHDQVDGRAFRDGQKEPVMSYFCVADYGSDPVIADVLGLKESQAHGIRDPDADVFERSAADPGHIRKLAEAVLRQRAA